MNYSRLGLAVMMLILVVCPAWGQDGKIFPYDVSVETLDNGLSVILVPMSSGGLVAYWSIVRTGSRDEYEPGRTGFAHFFEHMMFRGTERYPADVYNEMTTRMGADTNAYTTDDLTAYHLGITTQDLETVIEIEADRFQNLSYAPEVFKTEAGAVYGEYRKNRMSPFFRLFEAASRAAFTQHPYGHTTMGYEEDIKRMPEMYDYAQSFFSRYYRPENVVLLVVGEIQPEQTMESIRRHYGDWKPGYVPPQIPVEPEQRAARRVDVAYEGQSLPIVLIAYKADRFDPEDRTVLAGGILTDLAFGETSAIHRKLVLDEQVVEFFSADLGTNRDPGMLEILTRVKDPDRVDYVIEQIDATIAHYTSNLPDAKRLADVKSRLKYGFLMGLDTPDRVASGLARIIAVTGGIDAVERMYSTYDKITTEDVRAAAQRYFVPARRTVAVLRGGR